VLIQFGSITMKWAQFSCKAALQKAVMPTINVSPVKSIILLH